MNNILKILLYRRQCVFVIIFFLCLPITNATHFRGGTAWWSPVLNSTGGHTGDFRIEYYLGWRYSFDDFQCENDISERGLIDLSGTWDSEIGELGNAYIVCNEYDPVSDWMIGYNKIIVNSTNLNDSLHLWYGGRCWIDELYYPGCAWNLSLFSYLGIRSDIGKPNSTPKSGSIPIKRLQAGCPTTIEIPTTDPDGDIVRCRFAKQDRDDCGDICQEFPYFTFIEDSCLLSYNGGGSEALVTVAVVIEDYPRDPFIINEKTESEKVFDVNDRISYVPIQFLVSFYQSDDPCSVRPYFVRPTPPDGQTISTIVDTPINLQFFASPSGTSENISDFVFVFPQGARKSEIVQIDDQVYSVNVTWTPTSSNIGTNIFCFSAKDSSRISEQRCLTLVVGDEISACEVSNGGCSDSCVTLGTNYLCDCPRECWSLGGDERTCVPDVSIQCFPTSMEVKVSTCSVDSPRLIVGKEDIPDELVLEECKKREENSSYIFSFSFDQCGTFFEENFWNITYYNYIRLFAEVSGGDRNSVITRGKWYTQLVSCTFSKFENVSTSFQPENINVELLAVPGLGSFSFFIDFYNNITFEEATGPYDYPVPATINSDIYFAVRAVGGSAGMQLFTQSCDAAPTKEILPETPVYSMISGGCLEDLTMKEHSTFSPMEKRYSIKAFQFRDSLLNSNQSTVVFIRCAVVVCTAGATVTTCSQGCVRSKRKRSLDNISHRYKRQAITDDDDDVDDVSSNVTESPVHRVSSDGGVQITIDLNSLVTASNESIQVIDKVEAYEPAIMLITIAKVVGSIALILLVGVLAVICYHNKVIRPKKMIIPIEKNPNVSYVNQLKNIYVTNEMIELYNQHQKMNKDSDNCLWAQKVVHLPSASY